jgi:hypothetical protein
VAREGAPETAVHQGNLREREREIEVAEPPGQETKTPAQVWRRCRGGVGEIRLVEHNVSRDEDSVRGEVKATVPLVVMGVTEKHTSGAGR